MDILTVFHSFQTQEQCIAYLEKVRWKGQPECPYCASEQVCRHASGDRALQRWQCQKCARAFSVTVGTIFHRTHVPLQKWLLLLALMLNAKKSASACQIARDIGMRRPTVWSMMHRVRAAMEADQRQSRLLHGLVEADETYVGGKGRRSNHHGDDGPSGGVGRGTKKTPVLGVVERGGRVVAQPAKNASGLTIKRFIQNAVDRAGTILLTDQWAGYNRVKESMLWASVNHSVQYVDGLIHTNTIESFWSLLKRAWYGQHHHYSVQYMPLYVSEACFKYNYRRDNKGAFATLIERMLGA